jgi:hypothetical protein
MPSIAQRQSAPTPVTDTVPLPTTVPELPDDVFDRFPSLREWQENENRWWTKTYQALQGQNQSVSQNVSQNRENTRTLRVSFGQFRAEVTEEIEAIVDEAGAQAKRIVTVSAMAGINSNIKVQTTTPGAPSLNDYWIDTSDITTPVTYQWDGLAWVEVSDPISLAGVADERTARVTADGYLEGKYTLTVVAGDVVTGMNITSASGPGVNVSTVTFQADRFLIYSGSTNKTLFVADAIQDKVRIASVLTVDTATTSVYIKTTAGAGSYNSAGTPWFVDNLGRMSLGTGLTFDGSNLTTSGAVTASSGSIGGWTISSTTLSRNNATLDSAGQLILGTSNDVVYLSATDATYRIWIGNATAGSASFRVTKGGTMTATNGVFTGTITSTSGTIGGFTLSSTSLSTSGAFGSTIIPSNGSYISFTNTGTSNLLSSDRGMQWAASSGTIGLAFRRATDLNYDRLTIDTDGVMTWGNGSVTGDTTLFRNNANELRTNDDFVIDGALTVSGATQLSGGLNVPGGTVTASLFSGSGASLTTLNASNISSGTLSNSRLPAAISVTSLKASTFFEAGVTTAVDVIGCNFRVFNGGTQEFRVDYTNGDLYIQSVRVVRAQYGTANPGGSADPVANWAAACLTYHGLGT